MTNNNHHTVGVAIITHNAEKHIHRCLLPWLQSPLTPRVLVVNSSSEDKTVAIAQALGAETLVIPRDQFNHGSTRERARQHLKTDIIVMVTPDAYATSETTLETLITPLTTDRASIAYARQLPHNGAQFFESFHREYNYPETSHIRGIEDVKTYGAYTFFCSNSCAAYSNRALDEIGGFQQVLLGEDTVAVAKLLRKGHKIAYVAEATVHHSHNYNLKQEFQRHFDTGLARKGYLDLINQGGSDTKRGKDYVRSLIKRVVQDKPLLLPYACLQTVVKWVGYKTGAHSRRAPLWLKRICSSQDFYWKK